MISNFVIQWCSGQKNELHLFFSYVDVVKENQSIKWTLKSIKR
jgi:hypothetical protein